MEPNAQGCTPIFKVSGMEIVQQLASDYKRLLNKPYVNVVTLRGQNQPLKCCQPFQLLTPFEMGLDLCILIIWGLYVYGL